jgi:hypothetical protein
MGSPVSISPLDLYARIGTAGSPSLFDVRRTASFEADNTVIVGALRRDIGNWRFVRQFGTGDRSALRAGRGRLPLCWRHAP